MRLYIVPDYSKINRQVYIGLVVLPAMLFLSAPSSSISPATLHDIQETQIMGLQGETIN